MSRPGSYPRRVFSPPGWHCIFHSVGARQAREQYLLAPQIVATMIIEFLKCGYLLESFPHRPVAVSDQKMVSLDDELTQFRQKMQTQRQAAAKVVNEKHVLTCKQASKQTVDVIVLIRQLFKPITPRVKG